MRMSDLPSPGIGGTGLELVQLATRAISDIQTTAPKYVGGKPAQAATLQAFFNAASAALANYTIPDGRFLLIGADGEQLLGADGQELYG